MQKPLPQMKTKHLLVILLLIFISVNAKSQKIVQLAKNGTVLQSNYSSKIPFRYEKKHIFIDVTINGNTYNFLFDTGFDISAIDLNYLQSIDYKKVIKKKVSGSSFKKHKVQFIEISTLSISDIDFNKTGASIIDLSFINNDYPCSEKPIAGVIGANLLRKANWQIDYENKTILFSDDFSKFNISAKAFKFDLISKSWGSPLVNVKINGIDKKFTLDTGSSGKITSGTEFKKELNSDSNEVKYLSIIKKNRAGNEQTYTNYYALVEQINIGNLYLQEEIISLEKGVSSLIGNELFENFKISIDWKNNLFLLDPIGEINKEKKTYYEILLKPNYTTNKIEINGFFDNSSLNEKKYKVGTGILTINGINVSDFSTQMLCEFWRNKWREIKKQENILIETEKEIIELVKIDF